MAAPWGQPPFSALLVPGTMAPCSNITCPWQLQPKNCPQSLQLRPGEKTDPVGIVKSAFESVTCWGKLRNVSTGEAQFPHLSNECLGLCSPESPRAPASLWSQSPGFLHHIRFRFLPGAERGQVTTVLNLCAREVWLPAQCQACLTPVN